MWNMARTEDGGRRTASRPPRLRRRGRHFAGENNAYLPAWLPFELAARLLRVERIIDAQPIYAVLQVLLYLVRSLSMLFYRYSCTW